MKKFLACTIMLMLVLGCLSASAEGDPKRVGSIVTFGSYEQDNDTSDGAEPIEWLVLDVQGSKALLISRYGLDAKPYNESWVDVTWEECTLRSWLNDDFLNAAFTAEEQRAILTTAVNNSRSRGCGKWSTTGGSDTKDRLFLLSCAEANTYFGVKYFEDDDGSNIKARVEPTAYAVAQGAWTSPEYKTADGGDAGWWWLRSPGNLQYNAARVHGAGSLHYYGIDYSSGCVRPAFWLDLRSLPV